MIDELLQIYGLEELLERLNISPEETIEALLKHGYIDIEDVRPTYEEQEESE